MPEITRQNRSLNNLRDREEETLSTFMVDDTAMKISTNRGRNAMVHYL